MMKQLLPAVGLLLLAGCTIDDPPVPGAFAGARPTRVVSLPDLTFPDMFGEPYSLLRGRPERDADPGAEGGVASPVGPGASGGLTDHALTLLFIGYTYCPDVCPVHLANLATVLRDLPLEQSRRVRTIFLTADPERDTPERLREWLGAIHPDFVGLRGTRAEINALEDSLGLPRSVVDPGDEPESYFVGHAGQVLAFDPEGRARVVYPWGIRQRDWRSDLPRLIRGEWPAESTSPAGTADSLTSSGDS
jgi:hypothetical protein